MPRATDSPPPWHEGEVALQRRAGVAERMAERGRSAILDHLPDPHRAFFAQLPFVVLGTVDAAGDAWATLVAGRPGFVHAPEPRRLALAAPRDADDPADAGLEAGAAVALLGIELHSRRRNRANGSVARREPEGVEIAVEQAFGNCPQYIQRRAGRFVPVLPRAAPACRRDRIDAGARRLIEAADTFFVASYVDRAGGRQVDVSHRGGRPGFVRVDADGTLTVPDFAGNRYFNTLGNLLLNPRAGLVFVDFERGDLLQLTGDAEVDLDSPEIAAFQKAERLWRFRARQVVTRRAALPLRFDFAGWSPNTLQTGSWQAVAG